jgi:hydroxyacylglutathione hydrolase
MFQRYFDDGLAQASFLVACHRTRQAAIVDPRRDVEIYVEAARQHGLTIVAALETHIHADFVSGARELGAIGARTICGPGSALGFDHHEARDGERIPIGDITLTVLHTPGHTPEHISILVEEPGQEVRALTGDTLFVGAVGRPDLLGDELTRRLAGELYDSLHGKLLGLGDGVEVHPGHGAGSLCGAGIGSDPHSTIGQERRFNPMLRHDSRDAFVAAVLADLPETPPYFPRMKRINHDGPPVLDLANGFAGARALAVEAAADAVEGGAWLVDLRGADAFAAGHPRGAVNIAFGNKVGYWAGWVLPAGARIVLLANTREEANDAARQLLRVGFDRIDGYVEGGLGAWFRAGLPDAELSQMPAERLQSEAHGTIIDVRTAREWNVGHLEAATHVPVENVGRFASSIARDEPVYVICETGYRSSLAASLLAREGLARVTHVTGGMAALRGK